MTLSRPYFILQTLVLALAAIPADGYTCQQQHDQRNGESTDGDQRALPVIFFTDWNPPGGPINQATHDHRDVTSASSTTIKEATHSFEFCGHGRPGSAMTLSRPYFILQVSLHSTSFRSDARGIMVVPCPHQCLKIAYDCFLVCKLLVCGDVEANPGPGPSNKDILETLLAGQAAIQADISGIKTELANTISILTDLKNMYTQLDKKISEPSSSPETTEQVQSSLNSIASVMTFQSKKITDLEDRSRRSNLIIHGLEESTGETDETLKEKVVVDVFKSTLGVECTSIGRIHRLGRYTGNRPVIVHLQDFNEKKAIFANVTKLKGSTINIQNDFSQQTLRKRKLLWESAKSDKNDGKKVYLVNDRLKIDKDVYIWDETKGERVKVTKHAPKPSALPVISEPVISEP